MTTLSLDTHDFIKGLVRTGMPEKQAEAIVSGIQKMHLDELATKGDLLQLEARLEAKLTTRMVTFHSVTVALLGALVTFISVWS